MVPVFAVFPQAEGAWWSKIHVCHTWNCIIHIPVKGTILANTILLHPSTVTHSLLWVSAPSRYPHKTVRQQREPDHFFILIKHVSSELSQDTSVFFSFFFIITTGRFSLAVRQVLFFSVLLCLAFLPDWFCLPRCEVMCSLLWFSHCDQA